MKQQLSEPTDRLQSTSWGIMSLIKEKNTFCGMNYLSDLHFVSEGCWRGLASGEDHDDEDSEEKESEDRAHHSSGHSNRVWPLCLRLFWEWRETFSEAQTYYSQQRWNEIINITVEVWFCSWLKIIKTMNLGIMEVLYTSVGYGPNSNRQDS